MSENKPSALERVQSVGTSLTHRVKELALPEGIDEARFPQERITAALTNLVRRLREGGLAPLRVALFGPTGVGKSKLFNSLVGRELSPAGFRRPFTRHPVYLVHEEQKALLRDAPGEVEGTPDDAWRGVILVDTPDFDSVEVTNRKEAERIFGEAEAFLFVTDAQKYADHSTWEHLGRIFCERKRVILILNKVVGEGAPRDFFARLDERFGEAAERADRVVLKELPLDDATPFPEDDPGLAQVRQAFRRIVGTPEERKVVLRQRLRDDIDLLLDIWASAERGLRQYLDGLEALGQRLAARQRSLALEFEGEFQGNVDPAARAEVYSRVLQGLQRIDILRYPRKLLALPVEGLKSVFRRIFPGRSERRGASPEETAAQEIFEVLESKVLRLATDTSADFRGEERCPGLLSVEDLSGLRFSHEELRRVHEETERTFAEWLHREARETASQLTGEHKMKFILSQVIYNTVVVGVQIQTAGGFTFAELLTDGVLSPLVAKAVGIAVSSEAVTKFCQSAREERCRLLIGLLGQAGERFQEHLRARSAWRPDFESIVEGMQSLGGDRDAVLDAFEKADSHAGPESNTDSREGGQA